MNRIDTKPQKIEQGIMNVEVLKTIKVHNSKLRVRYSKKLSAFLKAWISAGTAPNRLPSFGILEKRVTWIMFDLKFREV